MLSGKQSAGACDLVAMRGYDAASGFRFCHAMLIEVKSTAGGPYERFGPAARKALAAVAEQAGGRAWLAWWPPRGELQFIPESEWPT